MAVEPAESAVLSGHAAGTHRIEGGGAGFRPPLLERDDFDEVIAVPERRRSRWPARAARDEGVFSGPSTGANLVAARAVASSSARATVVTTQVDSGLKYLAGALYA